MKVGMIGTGYVGLVSGTCFAEMGHNVTCIEILPEKLEILKSGKSPIYEPGLQEIMERNYANKRLIFSNKHEDIADCEAVFLAVGTPMGDSGEANLDYLFQAAEDIAPHLKDGAVIVIKSTVPVGTAKKLNEFLKEKIKNNYYVVNNPEFLKEGAAVNDFMKPDRIVLGYHEDVACKVVEELYHPFVLQGNPIYKMSNISAEMTKYAANCFLATKVSFINEIAKLCDESGADIDEVKLGMTSDKRISKEFFYPGPGYGGSCFPKDVNALVFTAKQYGIDLKIVKATEEVNKIQKNYMAEKVIKHFSGNLKDKKIAIWGTAFKANTDDVRETAALDTTRLLSELGANVFYYDPIASNNFMELLKNEKLNATMCTDKYEVVKDASALVIITEWKEFRAPDFNIVKENMNEYNIFDSRNLYEPSRVNEFGFSYFTIGKQ